MKASVGKNCFEIRYSFVGHIPNKYVTFNDKDSPCLNGIIIWYKSFDSKEIRNFS